jgi:hypothetical protein
MPQNVVTNAAWTDLGAGPLRVQALNSEVFIATGASAPGSLAGSVVLRPSDGPVDFDTTTLHVFAMSAAISGSAVVASVGVSA